MGIHTGDSITVAPAQTLTDKEYQLLRNASIAILREIGVDTGGSNVQFSINPKNGRMVVIEMNPRVSRSSALASKATGFPIAKVAAKLAVGYTLDELRNDITGGATPASFEPSIDYVVTKIPRFAFEKFPAADSHLTTQMKSVGEVMAMGRTFQESFQKALRGLETGIDGLTERSTDRDEIVAGDRRGRPRAHPVRGRRLPHRHEPATRSSRRPRSTRGSWRRSSSWCRPSRRSPAARWPACRADELRYLKQQGLLRPAPGQAAGHATSTRCAKRRHALERAPGLQARRHLRGRVRDADGLHVLDLRRGVRGRADRRARRSWCWAAGRTASARASSSTTAACTPRSRCARTATRPSWSTATRRPCRPTTTPRDRLYFEPVTLEDVLEIVDKEKPVGVIVQYGGQTPLKLALDLERAGVPIIGTTPDSIDIAEDRERFQKLLHELGLKQPPNRTARTEEQALAAGAGDRLPAGRAPELRARRPRDGDRARRQGPRALHARGGARCQREVAGAARPLPRRRDRGRRRLHQRRQRRDDRRHHGARRAGRHPLAATRPVRCRRTRCRRRCRTSCAARPR